MVDAHEIPTGAVRLQLAFVVGPQRNWLSLWKPTIDALDPLLGRTRADRDWHPKTAGSPTSASTSTSIPHSVTTFW